MFCYWIVLCTDFLRLHLMVSWHLFPDCPVPEPSVHRCKLTDAEHSRCRVWCCCWYVVKEEEVRGLTAGLKNGFEESVWHFIGIGSADPICLDKAAGYVLIIRPRSDIVADCPTNSEFCCSSQSGLSFRFVKTKFINVKIAAVNWTADGGNKVFIFISLGLLKA